MDRTTYQRHLPPHSQRCQPHVALRISSSLHRDHPPRAILRRVRLAATRDSPPPPCPGDWEPGWDHQGPARLRTGVVRPGMHGRTDQPSPIHPPQSTSLCEARRGPVTPPPSFDLRSGNRPARSERQHLQRILCQVDEACAMMPAHPHCSCLESSSDEDLPREPNTWNQVLDLSFHFSVGKLLRRCWGWDGALRISGTCHFSLLFVPSRRSFVRFFSGSSTRALWVFNSSRTPQKPREGSVRTQCARAWEPRRRRLGGPSAVLCARFCVRALIALLCAGPLCSSWFFGSGSSDCQDFQAERSLSSTAGSVEPSLLSSGDVL